jgi:hypothetical protein
MPQTLFHSVRERLLPLISRFGLDGSAPLILEAYGLICGESLSLPVGRQRPELCRINRDGTAIQFSLALSRSRAAALQFLGEAGAPGLAVAQRLARGREAIRSVANLVGAEGELEAISGFLDRVLPEDDAALEQNSAGACWIGVSFPPAGSVALTIYINARLDDERDARERVRTFVSFFGERDVWRRIEPQLCGRMKPLGAAVTLAADRPASGRVYFSAYGLPFDYYRGLLMHACSDQSCGELYDRFTAAMLGDERHYPARSAVCSFEFELRRPPNVKFELCAHCAFSNDAEVATRCQGWLESEGLDAGVYTDAVHLMAAGRELDSTQLPELHAYVGIGLRRGEPYSTFYLNPGPVLAASDDD